MIVHYYVFIGCNKNAIFTCLKYAIKYVQNLFDVFLSQESLSDLPHLHSRGQVHGEKSDREEEVEDDE
jgi:hypothetical protein